MPSKLRLPITSIGPQRERDLADLRAAIVRGGDEAFAASLVQLVEQHGVLLDVSGTVSSDLSLDVMLPNLVDLVTRTLHAERATLFLHDSETGELYSRIVRGGGVEEIRIPSDSGIAGAAFHECKVLNIPDAYADPRFNQAVDKRSGFHTRNILCAPLRNRARDVIGVTQVLNKRDGDFDAGDAILLETLTAHAAAALEHAQLFEALELARREQSEMLDLMAAVSSELNLGRLLRVIIEGTTKLLGAERGTFLLHDQATSELWSIVAEGMQQREIRIPSDKGIAGWSFTRDEVVNVPDAYADSRFDPAVDRRSGFRTRNILSMPVRNRHGRVIGVIQILNKSDGAFTDTDVRRLKSFSAQVVAGVENAQLFREVLELKNFNEGILKSLTNGVVTLDADNVVTKVNEAASRILAVEESELLGRNAAAFFDNSNPWIVKSIDFVARTAKTDFHLDTDLRQATGSTISVNLQATPMHSVEGEPVGSMLVMEDITREKRVRATMARYMAKEVVDRLLESGEAVLEGTSQEATVLFSDIRRFTTISEKLGPRETVTLLNEYFTDMVDIIFSHGGVLDKYIGDAIMAVFGAPMTDPFDANHALTVAEKMIDGLQRFNDRRRAEGEEPIDIGIGIATGEVMAGSIGSLKRMEYTVIGDTVNRAARLESANKFYGTHILLSADTAARVRERHRLREVDTLRAKGFAKPMAIYEPIDYGREEERDRLRRMMPVYHEGLQAYRARQWDEAIQSFEEALSLHPDDGPARVMLDRCQYCRQHPFPEDWDGVWTLQEK